MPGSCRSRRLLALVAVSALAVAARASAQGAPRFPEDWFGQWSGTLATYAPPDSVRNRIPLTLEIAREAGGSAVRWRTVFNADTVRGVRDYRLLVRDAARGRYATDEGNGIVLEETFIAGTLVSVFEVGGRVLESRYTLRGDTLTHDITWWSATPESTTRGEGANSEQGMAVRTFRVAGRQQAVLTRRPSAPR
ncbi:MAG TPA: hypothetical protein VFV33_24845 [Gemmatimonadaceae bacterium]|nr:hypothetical protein [Gemmatimonadaceae bacterium]